MDASELRDTPESWPVISSAPVYSDDWVLTVQYDQITRPEGGEPFGRIVVGHPGAAAALAIDEDDRVLLIRQYRHASKVRMVELPAGSLDVAGEDPLDVARRELQEEAGYAADEWSYLVSACPSPGFNSEMIHCFLARGLHEVGHGGFEHRHEEADLEPFWVPFDELVEAVLSHRVQNGDLVAAVLAYDALRRRGRLR